MKIGRIPRSAYVLLLFAAFHSVVLALPGKPGAAVPRENLIEIRQDISYQYSFLYYRTKTSVPGFLDERASLAGNISLYQDNFFFPITCKVNGNTIQYREQLKTLNVLVSQSL